MQAYGGDRMNILFISKLNGASWSGPTYSVMEQVTSQAEFDNVLWYNLMNDNNKTFINCKFYCDLTEYPRKKISCLPNPFNRPDLIILEQFYVYTLESILIDIRKLSIPYIIVPRGEFTDSAQRQKRTKKIVANLFRMQKYVRKASAIQYLSENELKKSVISIGVKSLILPNGTNEKKTRKKQFNKSMRFSFIGRIDPHHKGLDLLLEACVLAEKVLHDCKCKVEIYGPDRVNKLEKLKKYTLNKGIDDIVQFHDSVFGTKKENVLLNTDVFVLTSRFEGLPMSLIEALSYGVPCMVTSGTNMMEDIVCNNAGWGTECTAEGIANCIQKIVIEREELYEKSINAVMLSKKYEWKSIAKNSHEHFLTLINK